MVLSVEVVAMVIVAIGGRGFSWRRHVSSCGAGVWPGVLAVVGRAGLEGRVSEVMKPSNVHFVVVLSKSRQDSEGAGKDLQKQPRHKVRVGSQARFCRLSHHQCRMTSCEVAR